MTRLFCDHTSRFRCRRSRRCFIIIIIIEDRVVCWYVCDLDDHQVISLSVDYY